MGSTARQGTGGLGRGCRLSIHNSMRNPSLILILLLSIFLIFPLVPVVSADGQFCKACDVSYLTVGIVPSINLSNKVNVSAQLHYITVPDTSNPQAFIDDIQAGKLKINEIEDYVPSGIIFNETVEVYFRQNISGTAFESQHCNKSTNATGSVNCEVEVGTQGCGNIYAYYNGSEKYSSSLGSVPYCVRGAVPFTTLLGPECFTLAIFFGLLIAGMYATGKQPLKAFEIAKPRVKASPPMYPPHKWKRYSKLQMNKVAGSAYMKARTGMRIMSLNMLAGSLEKKGMLPAGMAARVKGLSIEDKVLKMLPNVREGIDKTNLVKMSAEKDLNEAAARLKSAVRKEDMVKLKAELKQKQAAYALAAASLRDQQNAYNKLIGHQLKDLDSFAKAAKDEFDDAYKRLGDVKKSIEQVTLPSDIIGSITGTYYSSMQRAREGAKQDPFEMAQKAINPKHMETLGDKAMLFRSVARAKIMSEEANNSAVYLIRKNIDSLPEGSKERKEFERLFNPQGMMDTRREFLEDKMRESSKDAYDRYVEYVNYSRNPTREDRDKIAEDEKRTLRELDRAYKDLKEETTKELKEKNAEIDEYIKEAKERKRPLENLQMLEFRREREAGEISRKFGEEEKELKSRISQEREMLNALMGRDFRASTTGQKLELLERMYKGMDEGARKSIADEWNSAKDKSSAICAALSKIDADASRDLAEMNTKVAELERNINALDDKVLNTIKRVKKEEKIEIEAELEKFEKDFGKGSEALLELREKKTRDQELQGLQENLLEAYNLSSEISESSRRVASKYSISYALSGEAPGIFDDARECAGMLLESRKFKEMK